MIVFSSTRGLKNRAHTLVEFQLVQLASPESLRAFQKLSDAENPRDAFVFRNIEETMDMGKASAPTRKRCNVLPPHALYRPRYCLPRRVFASLCMGTCCAHTFMLQGGGHRVRGERRTPSAALVL